MELVCVLMCAAKAVGRSKSLVLVGSGTGRRKAGVGLRQARV